MVYDADTLVVGGGLAGLACAVALAKKGVKPLVLERSARLGGRAHSVTDQATGDVIDIGPHLVHSEYRNFPFGIPRRRGGPRRHGTPCPHRHHAAQRRRSRGHAARGPSMDAEREP